MRFFRNIIGILFSLFSILLIVYVLLQNNFIINTEKNFSDNIKNEVKILQLMVKKDLYEIAKSLSEDPKLIKTLKNRDFKKLYEKNFFKIPKEYINYRDIKIHVVDKDGYQRYLSWTKKDLGKNILNAREDLQKLYKNPRPISCISVGKFSIALKGIFPIYDKKRNFLGVVEAITHPDFISKKLSKNMIYSAVIIDKKYSKQLIYPLSNKFVDGYNIANSDIKDDVFKILKEYGIDFFINLKGYEHIRINGSLYRSYHVLKIPILDVNGKQIGYYIIFAYDKFHLAIQEVLLYLFLIILSFIFFIMVFLASKEHKRNIELIKNLDNEVKKQIDEKMKLIYIDTLTGAFKKVKFDEDLTLVPYTKTVILNIKNFSKINETYGFDIGDAILKITVKRLFELLKRDIYRLNADEFLFFSDKPKEDIKSIKSHFIKDPIKIYEENISVRISFNFGVSRKDTDKLISKLSIALKRAKKHPFSDFMYYRDVQQKRDNNFLKFNSLLFEAMFEQNKDVEIVPYFQGIRNNISGKIKKFEALARLRVKDEIYTPYYFLDIAKNSGFIHEVTNIIIQKSFELLSKTNEDISISINITESDLATKRLKDILLASVKKYDISPDRITLEVLEGVTATGTKSNLRQLFSLKENGFKIAIDDFGVEYSNFERLSELDVDFIKVDGKYIKELGKNSKSYKITKAITDFAHSLGIKVVAEFVEDEETQKMVESLGIEYSQGYLFSKPNKDLKI